MDERSTPPIRHPWWRPKGEPLVPLRSVLVTLSVALTWTVSLSVAQSISPLANTENFRAWARICPSCGTVESVALVTPRPDAPPAPTVYRLAVRMADGSARRFERSEPIEPGSQVIVQGDTVELAADSAGTKRQ